VSATGLMKALFAVVFARDPVVKASIIKWTGDKAVKLSYLALNQIRAAWDEATMV
jgi:hypothetical protein